MKFIIPMMMLSMLAACNSGGGSGKGKVSREFMQTPVGRVERGMVQLDRTTGTGLRYYSQGDDVTVSIVPVDRNSTKVLVAIRSGKLYFYEQDEDSAQSTGTVTIEAPPTQAEIDRGPIQTGVSRVGNRILYNNPGQEEVETQWNATITSTDVFSGSMSLSDFYCDRIANYSQNNIRVTKNGVTSVLGNTSQVMVTTCGQKLSKDQLKELDLRNVTLCDDTSDEDECTNNQNMSYLTADIQ